MTGSEDDRSPVIQMWDLRYATAPVRTLEHHQRGVLSLAWCPQDADLLLTAAKDNRVLCWNPNTDVPGGEVCGEIYLYIYMKIVLFMCGLRQKLCRQKCSYIKIQLF